MIRIKGRIRMVEKFIVGGSRRTSAMKFIVGGAPILAAVNRNHHNANLGVVISNPFVKRALRVLVTPYVILAKENRPDLAKP